MSGQICLIAGLAFLLTANLFAQDLSPADREAFARAKQLQEQGDWLGARELVRPLVATYRGGTPTQHQLVFTNELANLDQRLGDYGSARAGYDACLELARILTGPESKVVAQLLNNLSGLHQVLGDFAVAEQLAREALALRERIEGPATAGTVPAINNLAGVLWCIGDYGGAESLFREGLEIRFASLGPDHIETARSMANLGGLLFYRKKAEEALPLVESATATYRAALGNEHPETLEVLLFLGDLRRSQNDPLTAAKIYEEVLAGRLAEFGGEGHVEVAEAYRRLGDALRESGDPSAALGRYEHSDSLYQQLLHPAHPDRLEGLHGLGLAALAAGDKMKSSATAKLCETIEFATFEAILQFTDERQRLAYQDLFRSPNLFANLGDGPALAEFLLRQKGLVIDSLIHETRLARNSSDPAVAQAFDDLATARARYRSLFLAGANEVEQLAGAEDQVRLATRQLLARNGAESVDLATRDLTLAQLQGTFAPGEILIDFLTYDRAEGSNQFTERYAAVVITKESAEFIDCAERAPLDALIAETTRFFGSMVADDATASTVLTKLHQEILGPLIPSIAGATSLVICPEAALHFVPFACLIAPDGKFLIEDREITFVTSSRELLRPAAVSDSGRGAILVGNPAFGDGNVSAELAAPELERRGLLTAFGAAGLAEVSDHLLPLEGTEREVDQLAPIIQSLGAPVTVIKGTQAVEADLRDSLAGPWLLHFATHGNYLPGRLPEKGPERIGSRFVPDEVVGFQNPLFGSFLALVGSRDTVASWAAGKVPDPASDGVLMAHEVSEFDLEGTLLVTLSACETASGETTSGDGVLGLRRGFRLAGAEWILTTLWPINDSVTVDIMKQFYSSLDDSAPDRALNASLREWLVKIRDEPAAVKLPASDGSTIPVGGLYWAVHLTGPFLLGR
jgi:CHAT domain-containing protein/tetratricopeptide (TPR) repeat protein